jgi:hypothetical protein
MIDTVVNLIFRCSHQRLSRPVTPLGKDGKPNGPTYVVCLDCGKHFSYDFQKMRVGRPLDLARGTPPRKSKWRTALLALIPAAIAIGSLLTSKGREKRKLRGAPPH